VTPHPTITTTEKSVRGTSAAKRTSMLAGAVGTAAKILLGIAAVFAMIGAGYLIGAHFRPSAGITADVPVPVSVTSLAPPSTTNLAGYRLPTVTIVENR
jgi:hypothetical protein